MDSGSKNAFRYFVVCLLIAFALGWFGRLHAQTEYSQAYRIFSQMTLEEKIAQLMIIRVSSTGTAAENQTCLNLIAKTQPGGVCFFKGGPVREAALTNQMQSVSKVPLFVSIDGEWGPAMRLDSCVAFPRQMTLGALSEQNDTLIYRMGVEIAKQCKAVGVNLNFAPCIDINNNAKNPVINSRSFGENRDKVAAKAYLYYKGMQDGGISGCIKHFPGHGDTETDSHLGLPTIHKSRIELDEMELYPYRQLIPKDVDMVMIGHLNIPALDTNESSVSSLSYPIISDLLKREYGFTGLITTDGLEMQGVQRKSRFAGDIEIRALLAGVDILLLPGKTETVIAAIKNAVDSGIIPIELIDERCLRVLQYKESKGLFAYTPVNIAQVPAALNTPQAAALNDSLEAKAVTMLKNDGILPIVRTPEDTVLFLCVGRPEYQEPYKALAQQYGLPYLYQEKTFPIKKEQTAKQKLLNDLQPYKRIILAFGGSNQLASQKYGVDENVLKALVEIAAGKEVVLLHLGNPYALDLFPSLAEFKSILVTYQSTPNSVRAALQVCFGERHSEGRLPVSTRQYSSGSSMTTQDRNFSALPEALTQEIDDMLTAGIRDRVYPGCVMLAIEDRRILYHKAFGNSTYGNPCKVTTETLFDLASITKTAATTLAVMKLYDEGKIALTDPISKHLPYLQGSNKAHITLAELLTHTSGLPAYIPFYQKIIDDERYLRPYLSHSFSLQVADNLFLRNDYPDTLRQEVAQCAIGRREYLYSDLNMLLLKDMVEQIIGYSIEKYLDEQFYTPMGLTRTCFHPLEHGFTKADIAPTERDTLFRHQVVQGYVHDQTAALFNGNAGNAGLFSTAEELAKIYQMLLDGGICNGQRLLSEQTVRQFTTAYEMHSCKVRGLGFHTPKHPGTSSIVPEKAGNNIFGHQGFTGTVVWCDPDTRLIYVFLSNRVYPTCYPNKLSQSKIRLKAHEKIYEK